MLLIGIGVLWAGYALTYFGWESLKGPGTGLLDLIVPGRAPSSVPPTQGAPLPPSNGPAIDPRTGKPYVF